MLRERARADELDAVPPTMGVAIDVEAGAELGADVRLRITADDERVAPAGGYRAQIDPTETWAGRDFRNAKSIVRRSLRAWYPPRHCMGMTPAGGSHGNPYPATRIRPHAGRRCGGMTARSARSSPTK